jgi:CheY-like chemotaxis protein
MKQLRDRHGIKGIALSGYGMEEDQRRSREAGFFDHVIKPVDPGQLVAVIQRIARS